MGPPLYPVPPQQGQFMPSINPSIPHNINSRNPHIRSSPGMPINFISVNNNFTNNQTVHYSNPQSNNAHASKNNSSYILKFNSKNDNDFYISKNISKRGGIR